MRPLGSDPAPLERPEDFPAAFAAAWAARDADALAALFAEDADFVNVVGLWWEDRAAIRRAHDYGLTRIFAQSHLAVGRIKLRDLGETAVVQSRLILTGQRTPQGEVAGRRTTILTAVMARRGPRHATGWICVSAQNTDVVPGAETHLAGPQGLGTADYRG